MTSLTKGKARPTDGFIEAGPLAGSLNEPGPAHSGLARYYFNLTDGETMIRDQEGIETASIQTAVLSAMEAVEELRAQDPTNSDEWQGWRLEIVDASGRAVQMIPLDARSAH
ncbi:hypothetical protein [Microvirga sp. VF16]|uniref:DUF6894 family protein n=1 Tax=Microvirga sp. VF16 TaxID=2807101 RepID=UPI00193DA467|nr:hypothetical protein [Microvirga sp. VF16]QRM32423.1 hypothetical protein JO965_30425 [Microvirga sp. VF16]